MRQDATGMLSPQAVEKLRLAYEVPEGTEHAVTRTGKWTLEVDFVQGLALHRRIRINVRTKEINIIH